MTDTADRPSVRPIDTPDPTIPLMRAADPAPRTRQPSAKRPPRLDWRPALGIALREPGGGGDNWQPVTAVAFHDGWVTTRIESEHGDQIMAFPAWRVIEIELKEKA